MTDPATVLTASTIATLAFQKFIESGGGELGKKFTTEAIIKMDTLLKRIWMKLRSKPRIEEVKLSVEQTQKITPEQVNQISAYLQVAMDEDPNFSNDIRLLAEEINTGRLIDKSNMTMNVHDNAKGWQTKVEGGTAYVGEINFHNNTPNS